jgi:hypothetical protein
MVEYDVTGEWIAHQSNGLDVTFVIRPTDGDFTVLDVEASHSGDKAAGKGQVSGDSFLVTVDWERGPVGRYTGTFGFDGRVSGATFDMANPSSQATWFSQQKFEQRD